MRHIGSLFLALLLAPLVLPLAGRGLVGLAEAAEVTQESGQTDHFGIVASASAVGLAGLIFGILTMTRISPLGPTLAGLGYLAVGSWALSDPADFLARVRGDLIGLTDAEVILAARMALLLAVPLLLSCFLPRRWRRQERPGAVGVEGAARAEPPTLADATTRTLDDIPPVVMPPPVPPTAQRPGGLEEEETTVSLRPTDIRPPGRPH